jgi:hypothetical protein
LILCCCFHSISTAGDAAFPILLFAPGAAEQKVLSMLLCTWNDSGSPKGVSHCGPYFHSRLVDIQLFLDTVDILANSSGFAHCAEVDTFIGQMGKKLN